MQHTILTPMSNKAMTATNAVDIDQLTDKLVDLKVSSRHDQYSDDNAENINHRKENKARGVEVDANIFKTAPRGIMKTVSKCKSVPRARKPLSNLTNTITSSTNTIQCDPNIEVHCDPYSANYYTNTAANHAQFPWLMPPNYPQESFASFPYQNAYYDMMNMPQAQANVAPVAVPQPMETSSVSDNDSIASTASALSKVLVQKIQLTRNNLSNEAWIRYSEQMIMAHDPCIVWDAPYALSGVSFHSPFDLILKVWHQRPQDAKKYFKIYLVHKQYATQHKHSSQVLSNVIRERANTVDIDIQVQDVCANAMKHVIVYMYTGRVTVTAKDLIPLYTLVERLKMKGDILKQLWINIRNQYTANASVLVPYLVQSESVEAYAVKQEIYAAITKRAERKQLKHVALQKLTLNQFAELYKESMVLSNHAQAPYDLVIRYINYFIQKDTDQHYARSALQHLMKLKQFHGDKCSVAQCIEFVKMMDILYVEEADTLSFYNECATKVQFELNPFDHDHCSALHHLQPQTFNSLLVNALHLPKSMIEVAILKYKELNGKKYRNQLKAFNFSTIQKQRSSIYGEEAKPSLASLSGTNDDCLSPPLLRTPPSPPKSHNICFSPVAPRYRVPPKLIKKASECSLLEQPAPFYSPDILDAAIASIDAAINEDEDEDQEYISPGTNIENGARDTLSFKRNESDESGVLNPRKNHIISPDFTPEKLVFRSRPATPRDPVVVQQRMTYKAPKINKGCLVETIDKYHSGVAKLYSPPKWRNDKPLNGVEGSKTIGNVLESRIVNTKRVVEAPRAQPPSGYSEGFKAHSRESSPPSHGNTVRRSGRSGSLSPSKKRGSGGAYCVECNEWRHKFDFTKSQWRNRPRGFRRCKFCTGEGGSDSKQSPHDWSPRRYRLKSARGGYNNQSYATNQK
eukprot:223028_1